MASNRTATLTYLCYAAMMALSVGTNLLPVFLTTISEHFGGTNGLSNEALGSISAVICAGLVSGIVLTSPLVDRFGTKKFAISGNLLTSLSLIACGLANSYYWLIISCFFMGLACGMLDIVLSPIVASLEPNRRSKAMNLLHSFYCFGAVATILLSTVIIAAKMDLRHACFLLSPFPAIVGLLMAPCQFPQVANVFQPTTRLTDLVQKRWFLLALIAITLGGATELGMAQWLPAYAETVLGYHKSTASISLLLFSLAMALGRMYVGFISHRYPPIVLMLWCCMSSVVFFMVASFSPYALLAFISAILAGFAGSALWPTTLAITADRYPEGGATMYGALAALGNAGGILMPWLVGRVADASNLRFGLATSALAPFMMFFVILAMRTLPKMPFEPKSLNNQVSSEGLLIKSQQTK